MSLFTSLRRRMRSVRPIHRNEADENRHEEMVRKLDTLVDNQIAATQAIKELSSQLARMQPTKRPSEKVLPWLEAATSIATVIALFFAYHALQDSSAQLALGRQQLGNARQAAQPSFQLRLFDRTGNECINQEVCDVARVTFHITGAAEQVAYSVEEYLILSKGLTATYYISPLLDGWGESKEPAVVALTGPSPLPSDLNQFSRNIGNRAETVYVVDAVYTDVFGVYRQKQWVLSDRDPLI